MSLTKVENLYRDGKYKESLQLANTLKLTQKSDLYKLYGCKGRCNYYLKNYQQSINDSTKCLIYRTTECIAWPSYYCGMAYHQLNNNIEAKKNITQAVKTYPKSGKSYTTMTNCKRIIEPKAKLQNEIMDYISPIITGMGKGLMDIINTIQHPFDEIVEPMYRLVYNSQIINSSYLNKYDIAPLAMDPSINDGLVLQHIIATNPKIVDVPKKEFAQYFANIKQIINGNVNSKLELASRLATSALLPGWALKALKINITKYNNLTEWIKYMDVQKQVPIVSTVKDLLSESVMYVLTEKNEPMIIKSKFPSMLEKMNVTHFFNNSKIHSIKSSGIVNVSNGVVGNIKVNSGSYSLGEIVEIFIGEGIVGVQSVLAKVRKSISIKNKKTQIKQQTKIQTKSNNKDSQKDSTIKSKHNSTYEGYNIRDYLAQRRDGIYNSGQYGQWHYNTYGKDFGGSVGSGKCTTSGGSVTACDRDVTFG